METLLNPDLGLMILTVITFLLLVAVLSKVAWKPIISAIESREKKIRDDLDRAEKSQKEAEGLRQKYETQLAEAQRHIQEMVSHAKFEGEKTRTRILEEAKSEAERILTKGRKELEGETERLKSELRQEVAHLSLLIAEKVLTRAVDAKVQEQVLKDSLKILQEIKK